MGKGTKLLVCTVWILLAYYIYIPVPDDLEDPLLFRIGHCIFRMMSNIMYIDSKYFGCSVVTRINQLQVSLNNDHRSLLISRTQFDGIPVKLFQPKLALQENKLLPAIIHFHGGGFVLGSSEIMTEVTKNISEELNVVVASVDYRLAPKHKFPAAFDDALRATKWLLVNAEKYNVDPNKIALCGESAGGTLSAAVSQFIKDDPSVPNILFQALIYPVTQHVDLNLPSYQQYHGLFGNKGILGRQDIANFIGLYAFGKFRQDYYDATANNNLTSRIFRKTSPLMSYINHDVILKSGYRTRYYKTPPDELDNPKLWDNIKDILLDVRMSPLFRTDMSGLPPAWIATCEYDLIRDDGILYGDRLKKAGVRVQLNNYEGGFHGTWLTGVGLTVHVYEKMMSDFFSFANQYLNTNI